MKLAASVTLGLLLAQWQFGCAPATTSLGAAPFRSEAAVAAAAAVPSRAEYATEPTPNPVRGGPLADELAGKLRSHYEKLGLVGDGRMADIATRVAAETQQSGKFPDAARLDWLARDAGFVGPVPSVFVSRRTGDSWDRLDEFFSMTPENIRYTRYGVVVLDLGGVFVGALALGASNVTLDQPVKRRVEPSERVHLRASLARGYRNGEVAWTRPDGSTQRKRAGDTAVDFETPALERGVHRIEILAVGPTGLEVLANMPVASGVELDPPNERPIVVDESDPPAALLGLVNGERQRAAVKPLATDPALAEVAHAHSQDMVDAHFFGHQSPTTGLVDDRLRAHGLRLGLFGENVAKGPSMAEAHAMLLASPAHRQNVMNPRFTHVGIGVVQERASDPPVFAVTEVFAGYPAPIVDPSAVGRSTLDALNQVRAKAHVPALAASRALDAAARDIAGQVAASATVSPVDVAPAVIRQRLAGTGLRRPLLLAGFALDPVELTTDDRLKSPRLRAAGVAVVQAPPAGTPRTNVIVFVLAE